MAGLDLGVVTVFEPGSLSHPSAPVTVTVYVPAAVTTAVLPVEGIISPALFLNTNVPSPVAVNVIFPSQSSEEVMVGAAGLDLGVVTSIEPSPLVQPFNVAVTL